MAVGSQERMEKIMRKRLLALVLAAAMAVSMVPLDVSASSTSAGQEAPAQDTGGMLEGATPLEGWEPHVGGMEIEHVELTEDMQEGLQEVDPDEVSQAKKQAAGNSGLRASQTYRSSWDAYSSNYVYNYLNQKQKTFWDALDYICYKYMTTNKDAVLVGWGDSAYTDLVANYRKIGLSWEEAKNVYLMFTYSNPQYYFVDSSILSSSSTGNWTIVLYGEFADGKRRKSETKNVKAQITAMGKEIAKGKTDMEKAKIAHDLIIRKVRYDQYYNSQYPSTIYHQSAYSVFCDNYTVCAGYTKAFELLMNAAGIECIGVTSPSHAWNLVRLNDSWYQVDCTWDDLDGQGGYAGMYMYFARSTAMITGKLDRYNTHQMEAHYNGKVPKCPYDSGATTTNAGTVKKPSSTVAKPKMTKKKVSGGLRVTLRTTTPKAKIYYTLDGKEPSPSGAKCTLYRKPFKVSSNVTVKAVAVCDGKWDSKILSSKVYGKIYTVKFNTRGGKKISSKKVYANSTVKKPSKPKRSGYKFAGWYQDKKYKKPWNFKGKVKKSMTLYAKWKKK